MNDTAALMNDTAADERGEARNNAATKTVHQVHSHHLSQVPHQVHSHPPSHPSSAPSARPSWQL